jgi:hypothetical protein
MQAGSQPIIVICKIKQIIPDMIFPCSSKESQGKKNAITYLIIVFIECIKSGYAVKNNKNWWRSGTSF